MIIEKWTDQLSYHMKELFKCGKILYSQEKNIHNRETEKDKEKKEKNSKNK